jgi:hypothetical protein
MLSGAILVLASAVALAGACLAEGVCHAAGRSPVSAAAAGYYFAALAGIGGLILLVQAAREGFPPSPRKPPHG